MALPPAPGTLSFRRGVLSPVDVRPEHPRLHFTPERLPIWRGWLADVWNAQWQQFITLSQGLPVVGLNADYFALAWLGGEVPGITRAHPLEWYGDQAVAGLLARVDSGHPTGQILNTVNHPFHSSDEIFSVMARAYDWIWHYPGFTPEKKKRVAEYLGHLDYLWHEELQSDGKPRRQRNGTSGFLASPGSEHQHPAYIGLAIYGDGYADIDAAQLVDTFEGMWLQGGFIDVMNYESRGDFGIRVLGNYGNWYPVRPLLMAHAWKTATGQDFITGHSGLLPATWVQGIAKTFIALEKPHAPRPNALVPLGQASALQQVPRDTVRMTTGVLSGIEAQWAAHVGGQLAATRATPQAYLQELIIADPTVQPVDPPQAFTWFSEAYGLLAHRTADGTHITMGAPPYRLSGHTWATQGGGPRASIPIGVTLIARGVPILVKHIGTHRNAATTTYGQNTMRFYQDWGPEGPPVAGSDPIDGGFAEGVSVDAVRVQEIKPSDFLGGIAEWVEGKAVAQLTKWYDPKRVVRYVRTYEWGAAFLKVTDDAEVQPGHLGWSRWYTGHRPVINGEPVADGITDPETLPATITLGTVTWAITAPEGTKLRIVGGPGHRWVNDRWKLFDLKADVDAVRDAAPEEAQAWLEAGEWTITFIGGSGQWVHEFRWQPVSASASGSAVPAPRKTQKPGRTSS